jgi:hypothetical protein
MRKPFKQEIEAYNKLIEIDPGNAIEAGKMIDAGKTPEQIAQVIGNKHVFFGILILLASNYMVLTGERCAKEVFDA